MGPKSVNIAVGGKGYMSDAQKCLNILYITSNPVPCVSGFERPTATHGLRPGAPAGCARRAAPNPARALCHLGQPLPIPGVVVENTKDVKRHPRRRAPLLASLPKDVSPVEKIIITIIYFF